MDERPAAAFVRRSATDQAEAGFLLAARQTGGLVSVLEFALHGWQSGPDLHLHADSDESFYVLDGELEFQVGEQRYVLGPGDFAWVPRGIGHTFANATAGRARALTVATPGGLEDYLAEQAAYLAGCTGEPDPAALDELRRRHGGRRLGPPIRPDSASRSAAPRPTDFAETDTSALRS